MPGGRTAATDDLGEYRLFGLNPAYYFVRRPIGSPASTADDDVRGTRDYSPGTVTASDARRVRDRQRSIGRRSEHRARAGQDRPNHRQPRQQQGAADGRRIRQRRERNNLAGSGNGAQLRPDGTFVIRNVVPGEHLLRARTSRPGASAGGRDDDIAVAGQAIEACSSS